FNRFGCACTACLVRSRAGHGTKDRTSLRPQAPARRRGRRTLAVLARAGRSRGWMNSRRLDVVADVGGEALEVLLEASGDVARHALVGGLVRPGRLGIEDLARHVRTGLR